MQAQKVAIIGAGPCGLAVCKSLGESGIDYECFEASEKLGGIWNVQHGGGGYASLHSNTSNPNMAFSDFPFAEDEPTFLNAAQMASYFNRYADHFGLREHIRLSSRVARADPMANGGWSLQLDNGEQHQFTSLVVAAGQYSWPHAPHQSIPGNFSGEQLHVHEYFDVQSPLDLRGKRVMVVGLGTSAAELAAELSNPESPAGCAAQVIVSARSGRWVVPKLTNGEPMDVRAPHISAELPRLFRTLPLGVGTWISRRMIAKGMRSITSAMGGLSSLGLPEPSIKPWEDRPTLSLDFIPALRQGRIDVRPGITRYDDKTVTFNDGSCADVDVVLYATGYDLHFPFLGDNILAANDADISLYKLISHPSQDSLFFIGYCRVMCALWPVAEQQSRWLSALLNGKFKLPKQGLRARKAIPLRGSLPVMCNMYVEELRKQMR